jgi:DEAD/DEAH box helicase domain-containing protein
LIEQRLFNNDLLAVVGTSALELGVDIGGINITLHCGYPSSHSSLLQQAGRAGRCSARLDVPSLAVMICFNSPSEQHMWRHPKNLLNRGLSVAASVPVNVGLVEGHLLCAGEEYPLTGEERVTILQCCSVMESFDKELLNDCGLLGAAVNYKEAVDVLVSAGSLVAEVVPLSNHGPCKNLKVYTTHPVRSTVNVFSFLFYLSQS